MKKLILSSLFCLLAMVSMQAQSITGKWKTIDEKTGKPTYIVEITQQNGMYYGKILEILSGQKDAKCDTCPADRKGKPIKGLTILNGMRKDGNQFSEGKILYPLSGKEYKCEIRFNGKLELNVRAHIGVGMVGRVQTWKRI